MTQQEVFAKLSKERQQCYRALLRRRYPNSEARMRCMQAAFPEMYPPNVEYPPEVKQLLYKKETNATP